MTPTRKRELSNRFAVKSFGVPVGRYAVTQFGSWRTFAGHFGTAEEAMAHADSLQADLDARLQQGRRTYRRFWLTMTDDAGTLTVYRDPATPVGTLLAKPIGAEHTLGSLGPADCCGGHRKACKFGKGHRWSVWKRDGHLVRGEATLYCRFCRGVCLAAETTQALPGLAEARI